MFFQWALAFLLIIFAPPIVFAADELQPFEDQVTRIGLLIPHSLVGRETQTTNGLNWRATHLEIDTITIPPERSLRELYEKMKGVVGRRIFRDDYSKNGFFLEGTDIDGSAFFIRFSDSASAGVSVVYSPKFGQEVADLALRITDSLSEDISRLEPEVVTTDYLRDARNILSTAATDPDKAASLWADFGRATRKFRLRKGRAAAINEIDKIFAKYPKSPLRSEAWGILPLGVFADFNSQTYSAGSIYGEQSEYPVIREELLKFIETHPHDPYVFAAYYAAGAFEEAITAANEKRIDVGMLHYAAGHKGLSQIFERAIPNLGKSGVSSGNDTPSNDLDCPTNGFSKICHFYETYTVHHGAQEDRLSTFLSRAAETESDKVKNAIESDPAEVRRVIAHLEYVAKRSDGSPHVDDANYYLGVIYRHVGRRSDAFARFETAIGYGKPEDNDYGFAAVRQVCQLLLQLPVEERLTIVKGSKAFSGAPAIWYALARDAYQHQDYKTSINIAELGLERLGIEVWRLPITTSAKAISDELERIVGQYAEIDTQEIVYLLNASRELGNFAQEFKQRLPTISTKDVRKIIIKYSLLATSEEEAERLFSGQLEQHRDLRQAIYLIDFVLKSIAGTSSPEMISLKEWLHYRKVRILEIFNTKMVEAAVLEMEQDCPNSTLLDDAYTEWLFTQAFVLRPPQDKVRSTFQLIANRFAQGNAIDNAYNWYAVYLQCVKDDENARQINMEIIKRFPLTRQAAYAAVRLSTGGGCSMWNQ